MDISDLKLDVLNSEIIKKSFYCADADLDDFFINSALSYADELLAVTYVLHTDTEIVAYFSLLNDKIAIKDKRRSLKDRFNKKFPFKKRINNYPAVKIGRLAVSEKHAKCGIGSQIIGFIKILISSNNKTGCRFITVDAYNNALSFYKKNGFNYLPDEDDNKDTTLMFLDIKTLTNNSNKPYCL